MLETDFHFNSAPITAVVCTRNRGDSIIATIKSILNNNYPNFNLLIVDQSTNDETEHALQTFLHNPQICYIRTSTKGLGVSHNLAISQASTELIAITDDDCEVPPNWLYQVVQCFETDARIGMVFGKVCPYNYDTTTGYVPEFQREKISIATDLGCDLFNTFGIGACMAMRRSAWEAAHGFDTALGPGSPLGSLEDRDMAVRIVIAGYYVCYSPDFYVVHYGFRNKKQVRSLAFQDWLGFGSCYAKYLKCGYWDITSYFLREMWLEQAVKRSLYHLFHEGKIRNITPVTIFWFGFVKGLFTKVDAKTFLFRTKFQHYDQEKAPTYSLSK